MDATLGFQPASELGPSPSMIEELEDLVRAQAAQIERYQDAEPNRSASQGFKSEKKLALIKILDQLIGRCKEQSRTIESLKKENEDLKNKLSDVQQDLLDIRDYFPKLLAEDRQRITALEERGKPKKTDVTLAHINALAQALLIRAKAGQRGVTYTEAANILMLDKSRICQLRSLIASDSRFNIDWHPHRKNTKVICLKNYKMEDIV